VLMRRRDDEPETAGAGAPTGPGTPEQAWFEPPGASLGNPAGYPRGNRAEDQAGAAHRGGPATASPAGSGTTTSDISAVVPGSAITPARVADGSTSTVVVSADAPAGDARADEAAGYSPAGWPEGPDWSSGHGYPGNLAEPQPSQPDRPNSQLGLITFCVALVSVGVLAVSDAYWASYPVATYIAVPLGVVGLGLLVGTWYGRSRGLIALGLLLSLALLPAAWLSRWDFGDVGDVNQRITSVDQLPADVVQHGGGEVRYDLSGLRLADGQTARLAVDQGAGELSVVLPADADVVVDAAVGAGDMVVLGTSRDGIGNRVAGLRDQGTDGPGGGRIVLDLELGLGDLEVTR
jgi:hypothetical protein